MTDRDEAVAKVLDILHGELSAGTESIEGERNAAEQIVDLFSRQLAEAQGVLNYVADMTYCGVDAEWHFKPGYDPQLVLDAIEPHTAAMGTTKP